MGEKRAAGAQMGRHGAAEIAGQQDGTEHRRPRDRIEQGAQEREHAEQTGKADVGGIAEHHKCLGHHVQGHELDRAVEGQEGNDQTAQHAAEHRQFS
ncbi:hypothetical protein D3C87_1636710 [compost metagenome]